MSDQSHEDRRLLVDASVFITLAGVGSVELLRDVDGRVSMPERVIEEITSEPAASELERALDDWIESEGVLDADHTPEQWGSHLSTAAEHLGGSDDSGEWGGDVPLLAAGLYHDTAVVVTDDRPLRETCNALSIQVSGSIAVLVRAVERGAVGVEEAKSKLEAMDSVGARLSASQYRQAERMIENAAEE